MNYRTACPHCSGHLEFESVHLGRTSNCPHCKGAIILSADPSLESETGSGWGLLSNLFGGSKQSEQTRSSEDRQSRISATMEQIRNGTWQVEAPGLVLSTNERALWRQSAAAVDPGAICSPESSQGFGVTTKILKSITTKLMRPPSQMRSSKPVVSMESISGEFILTTSRLVFTSRQRTFITRYENLSDVFTTLEGIRYSERDKAVVYGVKYDQPNGDIISQIIDHGLAVASAA